MSQTTGFFGGALDSALEEVAKSAASSISVADACTRETFLDGWSRTLSDHARHLRRNSMVLQAPVVLAYLTDTGGFAKQHVDWQRKTMLGASHLGNFAGILAVGTASVGGYVHPQSLADMDAFEAELHRCGLQAAPTIVLASETKLLIWPDGIDCGSSPFEKDLDDSTIVISLDAIDRVLQRFDVAVARQNTAWWKKASLRTTVERPEAAVQDTLWIFLLGKFSEVARIRKEDVSGNGRSDITVLPSKGGAQDQSAVLELKTLRDVRTPTKNPDATPSKISLQENIDWACSGVQQTAAYRDHEQLDGAFLCLYDFCAGNSSKVEEAVAPHALQYNVIARRYWITASHEEYRKHFYPLAKPAGG